MPRPPTLALALALAGCAGSAGSAGSGLLLAGCAGSGLLLAGCAGSIAPFPLRLESGLTYRVLTPRRGLRPAVRQFVDWLVAAVRQG